MGLGKTIRALSFLWLGSILGSGSTFLIYLILARKIGPAMFGLFSSTMATITIFSLVAGFGIPQVWLKLFGKEGWQSIRWIKPSLVFVGITLLIISIAVFGLVLLHAKEPLTRQLFMLLLFYVYGYIAVQLVGSKLQLEERYEFLTIWQMAPNLLRLLVIVLGYYILEWHIDVLDVGWIYAAVGFLFMGIGASQLLHMMRGNFKLKGHSKAEIPEAGGPTLKEVFHESWPFGFAALFAFIYLQSDIIMVKYLTGDREAGYYNVAFTILSAIMTVPIILFSKYLIPKYHRWANHDRKRFYDTYRKGNVAMLLSGLGILLGVVALSWYFIPLLFGQEYRPSVILLNILALTIPFSFLAYSYGATLLTADHMRLKVKLMGIVAIFNCLLNVILIPGYGAAGAAVATVLSNILLVFLYRYNAEKKVFVEKEA